MINWKMLYFGPVKREEVQMYIKDDAWQRIRRSMLGTSLEFKYNTLREYYENSDKSRKVEVQITNYITALSRGGLISVGVYQ